MKLTPKQITKKINKLKDKRAEVARDIELLQHQCEHIGVNVTYRSDTGNYCLSDNRYWMEWHCETCGGRWETPQEPHAHYTMKIMEAKVK